MSKQVKFRTLREANEARHAEWTNSQTVELTWRGTELAGEIGELAEMLMAAVSDGWRQALADEIGDGIICIDLTAMSAGCKPLWPISASYDGDVEMAVALGIAACQTCNTLKKLEREKRGWPGSRTTLDVLHSNLTTLQALILAVAHQFSIDANAATADKFNRTSENVGLATRFVPVGVQA
jgi:NTP pyrophosphatase (non-canonical NTP hydrolase)